MNKWVTNVFGGWSFNAVVKSRVDVGRIAEGMGYHLLNMYVGYDSNEPANVLEARILGIIAKVGRDDIVVLQYPSDIGYWFDKAFVSVVKKRGAKLVIFIQDAVTLREGAGAVESNFDELAFYNEADVIVAHGPKMEAWLREHGVKPTIINRVFHDYLLNESDAGLDNSLQKKLVVAGSLYKSEFLHSWHYETPIEVFGLKGDMPLSEKVSFGGTLLQDELIRKMPKNCFGILWDTDKEGGGVLREYTRYNAPHKIALYLALGLPVIVWDESATADLVKKYRLGYTISSLDEIDPLFARLGEDELRELKARVNRFSHAFREGFFTRKALIDIEEALFLN